MTTLLCCAIYLSLIPLAYFAFRFYRKWVAGGACTAKPDLNGRIAIITGSNTGIGIHTAEALARMGAHVVLACRNPKLGKEAVEYLKTKIPGGASVEFIEPLDLADLSSVRTFASAFLRRHGNRLHLLINNAGVMMIPNREVTRDGFEMQMGTNHLGHFALTLLLKDALLETAKDAPKGAVRIVNVASLASELPGATLSLDNLQSEKSYSSTLAYFQAKIANVLFTRELARRFKEGNINISTFALHPGNIATELSRYLPFQPVLKFVNATGLIWLAPLKSPVEGAQTNIFCAVQPGLEEKSGEYFSDCKVKKNSNPIVYDVELAKKLWDASEKLVNLKW